MHKANECKKVRASEAGSKEETQFWVYATDDHKLPVADE